MAIPDVDQPGFERFHTSFRRLSQDTEPDVADEITNAAMAFAAMPEISAESVIRWVADKPSSAYVLGLVLGMTRARLKNELRQLFGVHSATRMAKSNPAGLVAELNRHFGLIARLSHDLTTQFMYADVLVARYAQASQSSSAAPRNVEDEVEHLLIAVGVDYVMHVPIPLPGGYRRGDFAIPDARDPALLVVARGFDTPGPLEADTVAGIVDLALAVTLRAGDVGWRRPELYVVMDGIGWPRRDVVRLYQLFASAQIDGLYTLATISGLRDRLTR